MSGAPRRPILLCLALAVSGCAFAAQPLSMVPPMPGLAASPLLLAATPLPSVAAPQPATLNVRTAGGAKTRLWGKSQISNVALAEAVQAALSDSQLFLPLVDRAADYQLEVVLEHLDQPDWGVVTTVRVSTRWRLTRTGAAQPLWTDTIAAEHTATLLDAVIGTRRCRLATEGAAREAIRLGVERLARVPL
ncbi:MAG: hypothetical protein QNK04_24130 [Myxococcota bacterium]|nr:hypothetical protein [Myxococcota bacterium]